jgi:hypothetical protein
MYNINVTLSLEMQERYLLQSEQVGANLFLRAHIFGNNNTWVKGTVSIARKTRKLCFTF